jgi:DNA-binding transcriptional LysR family regulator
VIVTIDLASDSLGAITLSDLTTFLEVARRQSFSAAALGLGIGQPAVSRRVRRLEQRLGVSLLERSTSRTEPVVLTSAGAMLLARIEPALDDLTAALASRGI